MHLAGGQLLTCTQVWTVLEGLTAELPLGEGLVRIGVDDAQFPSMAFLLFILATTVLLSRRARL
ncbi:hypothetical protein ABS71_18870 [bacterium SCN 62-11]|nr:MAG: hypothetical protein ABS71_18870 [bacterium SCN 62-11]